MKRAGRKHQAPDKSLLALGLVLCLGTVTAAKPHTFGETQASDGYAVALVITVRIYNYARVPTPILVSAEGEAQKIFRQAGVETEWLDCRLPAAEPRTSACRPATPDRRSSVSRRDWRRAPRRDRSSSGSDLIFSTANRVTSKGDQT